MIAYPFRILMCCLVTDGGGALILLVGLVASQLVAVRLSRPVEKLAVDSAVNALQRSRAEAALELTQAELEKKFGRRPIEG